MVVGTENPIAGKTPAARRAPVVIHCFVAAIGVAATFANAIPHEGLSGRRGSNGSVG